MTYVDVAVWFIFEGVRAQLPQEYEVRTLPRAVPSLSLPLSLLPALVGVSCSGISHCACGLPRCVLTTAVCSCVLSCLAGLVGTGAQKLNMPLVKAFVARVESLPAIEAHRKNRVGPFTMTGPCT